MTRYRNSPIIEAVCEFKFTDDTEWDITIPGLLYNNLKVDFPKKTKRFQQNIDISTKKESGKIRSTIQKREIAIFIAEDEKSNVNIGERLFSVNQLRPYVSWADFKSNIQRVYSQLSALIDHASIQRIGLRYINRIEIPKNANLMDYFEFRPFLGSRLRQDYNSFVVGCRYPYEDNRDQCKLQLTNAMAESADSIAFILDIDYMLNQPKSVPIDGSREWVENAHNRILENFEGCISDTLRDQFEEEI